MIYRVQIGGRTAHRLGFRISALTEYTSESIVARGKAIYQQLRNEVEPHHNGKFLAIDIKTADYEIDEQGTVAINRLLSKRPDAVIYLVRIGQRAVYRLGFRGPYGTLANKVRTNPKPLK